MLKSRLERILYISLGTVLALAVAGFLFAWSGIYNVAASRGHWAIVEWMLSFAMSNSVELRAMMVDVPNLDDADMVVLGANHYRTGCAPCHGAPGAAPSPVVQSMLPPPPNLTGVANRWKDGELFWIVKHGIKYTGMPHWVSQQRDDEVWAVVAFLRTLPGMNEREYAELIKRAAGAPAQSDVARTAQALCSGCHGAADNGPRSALVPRLHGQKPEYLAVSLEAYAKSNRNSGIMQPVASDLSVSDAQALAAYYSALPPPAPSGQPTPGPDPAAGRQLAVAGAPEAGIPACAACHASSALPTYPLLAGQSAAYLANQLRLWKQGRRALMGQSAIMAPIAERMTEKQIDDVSAFYAAESPIQASH